MQGIKTPLKMVLVFLLSACAGALSLYADAPPAQILKDGYNLLIIYDNPNESPSMVQVQSTKDGKQHLIGVTNPAIAADVETANSNVIFLLKKPTNFRGMPGESVQTASLMFFNGVKADDGSNNIRGTFASTSVYAISERMHINDITSMKTGSFLLYRLERRDGTSTW